MSLDSQLTKCEVRKLFKCSNAPSWVKDLFEIIGCEDENGCFGIRTCSTITGDVSVDFSPLLACLEVLKNQGEEQTEKLCAIVDILTEIETTEPIDQLLWTDWLTKCSSEYGLVSIREQYNTITGVTTIYQVSKGGVIVYEGAEPFTDCYDPKDYFQSIQSLPPSGVACLDVGTECITIGSSIGAESLCVSIDDDLAYVYIENTYLDGTVTTDLLAPRNQEAVIELNGDTTQTRICYAGTASDLTSGTNQVPETLLTPKFKHIVRYSFKGENVICGCACEPLNPEDATCETVKCTMTGDAVCIPDCDEILCFFELKPAECIPDCTEIICSIDGRFREVLDNSELIKINK